MSGKVYLVGAGPGDPELLTLKALRVLKQADIILHDDLVSAAVLELAVPGTRLINVGKRCGPKSISQEEIHARLIGYARRGLEVVRLKGGDPLIFGRAGEELAALRRAGVDFEIVPGITAAAAAAAVAEVPLTHRRLASALVFLTGHRAGDQSPAKWPPLDNDGRKPSGSTVVVYMPGPGNAQLRDRLLAMGFESRTPCLIVSGASTANCRTHRTTLGGLPTAPPLDPPRILIVGEVAALARQRDDRRLAPVALGKSAVRRPESLPMDVSFMAPRS
jgi:uroporphyrin-III C-methyltransferase / precorrin-2 dehydrogenase / sirohydrochlorin ferrochelatase